MVHAFYRIKLRIVVINSQSKILINYLISIHALQLCYQGFFFFLPAHYFFLARFLARVFKLVLDVLKLLLYPVLLLVELFCGHIHQGLVFYLV